jgi:ADP-heptose:LPS heptosyltransferase
VTPRDRLPVLVLRALGLGDALTAIPALRGLRRAFAGHPLVLAADGPPARLLTLHGLVDDVVPTADLDAPPPGSRLGPHLAVNLHGRGPQSHRLLLAGSPVRLIAYGRPDLATPGPAWDPDEHEVLRWCRLVRWAGGHCDQTELRLTAPDPDGEHTTSAGATRTGPVVVHPGASTSDRRWPQERFAALARSLAAAGHPVVVTGTAAEARPCAAVVAAAGLPSSADLAGTLDLTRLACLLSSSRLLVCGDTGVAHLATALATPSVLLFGPVPPSRWGPVIDPDRHRVLWHSHDPLLGITVAEAVEAALTQLAQPAPPIGTGGR